jgi:DNA-binding LytR/AlgR family response regulator
MFRHPAPEVKLKTTSGPGFSRPGAAQQLGFLRIHRNHAVNLRRLAEVRRRRSGIDWEVKLEPPVNRVLPVARGREEELVAALAG